MDPGVAICTSRRRTVQRGAGDRASRLKAGACRRYRAARLAVLTDFARDHAFTIVWFGLMTFVWCGWGQGDPLRLGGGGSGWVRCSVRSSLESSGLACSSGGEPRARWSICLVLGTDMCSDHCGWRGPVASVAQAAASLDLLVGCVGRDCSLHPARHPSRRLVTCGARLSPGGRSRRSGAGSQVLARNAQPVRVSVHGWDADALRVGSLGAVRRRSWLAVGRRIGDRAVVVRLNVNAAGSDANPASDEALRFVASVAIRTIWAHT